MQLSRQRARLPISYANARGHVDNTYGQQVLTPFPVFWSWQIPFLYKTIFVDGSRSSRYGYLVCKIVFRSDTRITNTHFVKSILVNTQDTIKEGYLLSLLLFAYHKLLSQVRVRITTAYKVRILA